MITLRCLLFLLCWIAIPIHAQTVEGQPLAANVSRLLQALDFLGTPIDRSKQELADLKSSIANQNAAEIQGILDPAVLLKININPESKVKVTRGPTSAKLHQGAFSPVIVKITNQGSITSRLRISSPQSGKVYAGGSLSTMKRQGQTELVKNENTELRKDRFLQVEMYSSQPMTGNLSGLEVEYAIALIASEEAGKREATIGFDVGEGTQDIGFRGEVPILFDVSPANQVALQIRDFDDKPTTARLVITDRLGRIFPAQAKRLAPDLFFQKQIYRVDGETIHLPPGQYRIQYSRGPEYVVKETKLTVPDKATTALSLDLKLERWVNPAAGGFFSGDHHIHASGCAHYDSPTVGIGPPDIFRHIKGEGLNVGSVLTWGPGFDHQRKFFTPDADAVSEGLTLLKYDLEISGFGSAPLGHVCLLNLKNQTYPGSEGTSSKGWPSWTIPVMRWTKEQGGFAGYAHSASGLHIDPESESPRLIKQWDENTDTFLTEQETKTALLPFSFEKIDTNSDEKLNKAELISALTLSAEQLPNLAIPGMNGAGALEIAVSSAMGVCDFISAMDTARIQEWNTWYHLLNCGMKVKVSGETDFPCMSGTRVGQGRVYVQLGDIEKLNYAEWCSGLAAGRSYVSDGYAHALDFSVNKAKPGLDDVELTQAGTVTVKARVSFAPEIPIGVPYGNEIPQDGKKSVGDTVNLRFPDDAKTESGGTRLIEIVVNGKAVASRKIPADGKEHDLQFDVSIQESSWVALRHFPQLHTNPVNVIVAGKPIRASADSARWCIAMTQKLWVNRAKKIRAEERQEARKTYDKAIAIYEQIREEADTGR